MGNAANLMGWREYMGRINPMNRQNKSRVEREQKLILMIYKKLKTDKFRGLPSTKRINLWMKLKENE